MKPQKTIIELARELRKNPTPSEKKLWEVLRKRRLGGYRFIRQKPIVYDQINDRRFFFIVDFYCPGERVGIELDGKVHQFQQHYDRNRDAVLERLDINVIRIRNEELNNMGMVRKTILKVLNREDSQHPRDQ